MSEFLIVRINEKLNPDFQINYNSNNNTAQKSVLSSWSEIQTHSRQKLVLIISADLVFNTHVTIPSKNEEVIRQSIPFAIEEKLANEITENHFSYQADIENEFLVSVINHNNINEIIRLLKEHHLKCDDLYSEIFSIPTFTDQLSILNDNSSLLVNGNHHEGTRINVKTLSTYLQLSESNKALIFSDKPIELGTASVAHVKLTNTALLQAQTICSGNYVNLFQGDYQAGDKDVKNDNPWKKVVFMSVLLIISWLGINLYQLWQLNAEISQLKDQQQIFLQKAIPNANQIQKNDPYAAIQSFLKGKQSAQGDNNASGLMTPLYYLGKTLKSYPDIQVQSLRKRENKLEIKLLAPNVNVLNNFQSQLDKMALSMRVRIGTRDSSQSGIVSVITMEQL